VLRTMSIQASRTRNVPHIMRESIASGQISEEEVLVGGPEGGDVAAMND
jgi:hypothetical protein